LCTRARHRVTNPGLAAWGCGISPRKREFLVDRCDEHITVEFRHFLSANGCPPTIITQAGY
jgi:hypothetical protein